MKTFEYTIKDELGIHARPAGLLVKEAKKFESECTITKDGKTKKLTQLMMLMSLGVKQGDTVTVSVDGADEDAAVAALKAAYAGLVKADDGNGGNNNQGNNNQGNNNKGDNVNKPGTPNNTNVAGKNNTTNKGTVKTGDTAPFMAMIVTILAAAGVIFGTVAQKTRRRRNRK